MPTAQPKPTPSPAPDPTAAPAAELTRTDLWDIANGAEYPKTQRMRALRAIELLDQLTLWQRREALKATRAAITE